MVGSLYAKHTRGEPKRRNTRMCMRCRARPGIKSLQAAHTRMSYEVVQQTAPEPWVGILQHTFSRFSQDGFLGFVLLYKAWSIAKGCGSGPIFKRGVGAGVRWSSTTVNRGRMTCTMLSNGRAGPVRSTVVISGSVALGEILCEIDITHGGRAGILPL